jgi:phosphoribosylamine--glycine ligase
MKVLVVGGGGREHALCWKLSRSSELTKLYCTPGNAGIAEIAECPDIRADDLDGLLRFCRGEAIDLTVVGPEAPLVAGIADRFAEEGLRVFGPGRGAARLEGSKVFAKGIMRRHAIPTAEFKVFRGPGDAEAYLKASTPPYVVKADGLAAGKGTFVCRDLDTAIGALDAIMVQRRFGDAGDQVLIEECLTGAELSLLALTDGRTIVPLEGSRDYKRALDGDQGPNTGGMGAFSPSPPIDEKIWSEIEHRILVPMVHAIRREGHPYVGLIYLGIMLTPTGPKLLEVNVRFGDPETQPLMMRLKGDLLQIMLATIEKRLDGVVIEWDPRPSVCVVMASKGYPGSYETGKEIRGLDTLRGGNDVAVFHAGTERFGGRVCTSGGRVLGVTALGENREEARKKAYEAVSKITFEGAQYRKDIAAMS